jgi:hypothetical protein
MGATPKPRDGDQYSDEETIARRDATIKRMLATPPKPHSEIQVGKSRAKSMTPKGAPAKSKKKNVAHRQAASKSTKNPKTEI